MFNQNLKNMNYMNFKLIFVFVILLTNEFLTVTGLAIESKQEDCVVSLVIPKDSIKSSCDTNKHMEYKMKSIDSQFTRLWREVRDIQVRLAYAVSKINDKQEENEMKERLNKLEAASSILNKRMSTVETDFKYHESTHSKKILESIPDITSLISKKKLHKLMRPLVKKEVAKMRETLQEEMLAKLRKDLLDNYNEVTTTTNAFASQFSTTKFLMNSVTKSKQDTTPSTNVPMNLHYVDKTENEDSPMGDHHKLDKNENKGEKSAPDSASDNIFPESNLESHPLQADANYGNHNIISKSIEKMLDFRFSVQQERVKRMLNFYLNQFEDRLLQSDRRLARILEQVTNLKKEYDKKITELSDNKKMETNNSTRLDNLDKSISSLVVAMEKLTTDFLAHPEIKQQFRISKLDIENNLANRISEKLSPIEKELDSVRSNYEKRYTQQSASIGQVKTTIANLRKEMHYIDKNVSGIKEALQVFNASLSPEYDFDTEDDLFHKEQRVESTVRFVQDIVKPAWNTISDNLTEIQKEYIDMSEHMHEKFDSVEIRLQNLKYNQSMLAVKIQKMRNSMADIKTFLNAIEEKEMEEALKTNKWIPYRFEHSYGRSECHGGKQYIKRTTYFVGKFVGVVLCNATTYKIYLSDALNETFLDIGDSLGSGEDHCEFVGGQRDRTNKLGKAPYLDQAQGYQRQNWGDMPHKGVLDFFVLSPQWYECGVPIPG